MNDGQGESMSMDEMWTHHFDSIHCQGFLKWNDESSKGQSMWSMEHITTMRNNFSARSEKMHYLILISSYYHYLWLLRVGYRITSYRKRIDILNVSFKFLFPISYICLTFTLPSVNRIDEVLLLSRFRFTVWELMRVHNLRLLNSKSRTEGMAHSNAWIAIQFSEPYNWACIKAIFSCSQSSDEEISLVNIFGTVSRRMKYKKN